MQYFQHIRLETFALTLCIYYSGPMIWTFLSRKKSTNPNFWVWISSGGVGVFDVKGWGPKSSACPSKPRELRLFGGMSRDFCWGIPEGARKVWEEKVCVQFSFPENRFPNRTLLFLNCLGNAHCVITEHCLFLDAISLGNNLELWIAETQQPSPWGYITKMFWESYSVMSVEGLLHRNCLRNNLVFLLCLMVLVIFQVSRAVSAYLRVKLVPCVTLRASCQDMCTFPRWWPDFAFWRAQPFSLQIARRGGFR